MIEAGELASTYVVADGKPKSFAATMRTRRFKIINSIIEEIVARKGRCSILDVGGSEYYWKLNSDFVSTNASRLTVTITNLDAGEVEFQDNRVFRFKSGDATTPELYQGPFDFIHSNSVIEHVGNWNNIHAMASNIIATGLPYYVQTPNFWFPMEPHFRTIGFQYLPLDTRAKMLLKKRRGFRIARTYDEAMQEVESVNLLTASQMSRLFPDAELVREYVGPFTKSMMVLRRP